MNDSNAEETLLWHTLSVNDVLERLRSDATGLASGEAARRLEAHGPNELQALERTSAWRTLGAQFLYVNLATDGLPALALAVDPPEKDLGAQGRRR